MESDEAPTVSVQALSCAMVLRGVSASEKLLLLVLANYADDSMSCWPSHKRLADDTCLSQRTILSLLKSLQDRRVISRKERFRRDGSRTSDVITLHFSGEVASPPPEDSDTGPVKSTTPGGAGISPLTTFEPTTEPSEELTVVAQRGLAPDWQSRLIEASRAAAGMIDQTSTGTMHAGDLRALCEPVAGEPCEWPEVLDAIRVCAARAKVRGKPIRSWSWVKDDALALRDKRLTASNPAPREAHEQPSRPDAKLAARQANHARALAGADLASRLRGES